MGEPDLEEAILVNVVANKFEHLSVLRTSTGEWQASFREQPGAPYRVCIRSYVIDAITAALGIDDEDDTEDLL